MGKNPISLLIFYFLLIGSTCIAQSPVKVSDPILEMSGNNLLIHYDIIDGIPGESYDVNLVIKDENGNAIAANALSGDIGVVEGGGIDKQITWNLEADQVYLDADVFVQVNVNIILPGRPGSNAENALNARTFSRASIIAQSIAVPGLGLSRMTGKPHWIRAVAGYGCLSGSLYMGRKSVTTYDGIEDLENYDDITQAYNKASRQNSISNVLLFTAAGIWITDIIWTISGSSESKRYSVSGSRNYNMAGTHQEPVAVTPLFILRYEF